MDAFDADVLIYAAAPAHPLGVPVRRLFAELSGQPAGVGSVLLLPEVLAKPAREGASAETAALQWLLARVDLRPLDRAGAALATTLAADHRLRAADAVHLATAMTVGADRFLTNNRRDFRTDIHGIDVVYPGMLERPGQSAGGAR